MSRSDSVLAVELLPDSPIGEIGACVCVCVCARAQVCVCAFDVVYGVRVQVCRESQCTGVSIRRLCVSCVCVVCVCVCVSLLRV